MQYPTTTRILATYALAGPLIGGLTIFIGVIITTILPDFFNDFGNKFGHNRVSEFFGTFGLTLTFSFLLGILPALVAGSTHAFLSHHFQDNRALSIAAVCFIGTTVSALLIFFIYKDASKTLLLAPIVSTLVLATYLSR
jgi:ABC-type uncharacterized transport system permease subunit